ncbi:hypothetical protein CF326_g3213 [Tilletia indica]|nr:hypothetical protein CF326_g3213 [Tilletia indica]
MANPPKKRVSSTTEHVTRPGNWKKLHAKALNDAVEKISKITGDLGQTAGVGSSAVLEAVLGEVSSRRKQNSWNTFVQLARKYPPTFVKHGVPKQKEGQDWNEYVANELRPFWNSLKQDEPISEEDKANGVLSAFEQLAATLTLEKKAFVTRISSAAAAATMRQEVRWIKKKTSDLEENHSIVAITLLAHPDPRIKPVAVVSDYGDETIDHVMRQARPNDTINELLDRLNSAVTMVRPASYDYQPPVPSASTASVVATSSSTASSSATVAHRQDPSDGMNQATNELNTTDDALEGRSAAESSSAAPIPTGNGIFPATLTSDAAVPGTTLPSDEQQSLTSVGHPQQHFQSQQHLPRSQQQGPLSTENATFPSSNNIGTQQQQSSVHTRNAHFQTACAPSLLPATHTLRVPYVGRQLLLLLTQAIHQQRAACYEDWMQITQGMTRLPYIDLFTRLNRYSLSIDGWPNVAGPLLVKPVCVESLIQECTEVYAGGLLDTAYWREEHVLAIAASMADGTLVVSSYVPSDLALFT